MADNYYEFATFSDVPAGTASRIQSIGYNKNDKIVALEHIVFIVPAAPKSLHIINTTTAYKNTTGKTVFVIVTVRVRVLGATNFFRIFSAPTTDSISGATEVYDSADFIGAIGANGNLISSFLVPIQDNHFVVIENSGTTTSEIEIHTPDESGPSAIVVEPA